MKPTFNKRTQLAEQVIRILEGDPTKDSQLTFSEVELLVDQVYAEQIKINLFSLYKVGEGFNPGQYLVTFEDVPVKNSTSRNRNYIDIPARYVDLPGNRGLWSIGPMGNDYNKFIPLKAGATNFFSNTDTPFLQGQIGFEVEGLRAYFTQDLLANNLTSVLVQLVTASATEIDINIPADLDINVIKGVLVLLGMEKPTDKVADQNEAR